MNKQILDDFLTERSAKVMKTIEEEIYKDEFLFGGEMHPANHSYYVEELIKGQETNISYIMSNGKWAFTFSESCDESKAKQILYTNPVVWYANTTIEELNPELDKMVRDNVVEYLNQAAKLGGTYEGSITQMLGEDGELYFLENNCRPYVNNTFPIPRCALGLNTLISNDRM